MQHAARGDKYSFFCINWHLFVFDIKGLLMGLFDLFSIFSWS